MKNWKHIRQRKISTVDEMNEILKEVKELCVNIYYNKFDSRNANLLWDAYIEDNGYTIKITYKPFKKAITYIFDTDGRYQIQIEPKNCVSQMSRAYKIERTKEILNIDPVDLPAAKPLLYKNKKYDGKAVNAYEYDLSQAYAQMLKLPLPITSSMQLNTKLKEGQIGFILIDNELRLITEKDFPCDYVFDTMQSPYIKWIDRLFERCDKATDVNAKTEVKSIYRFAVGDLQNINPFWRATIVGRCNELVKSYMNEDTIYCNTDSIISTTRRLDLEADTQFKWKLKRVNEVFKWQSGKMNYQWNDETPTMRGPQKRYIEYYNKTHDKKWDILTNDIPNNVEHQYKLNRETLQIEENTEYGKIN